MSAASDQQRRKRKRILRQPVSSLVHNLLSVRSLTLCFAFLTLLYLLSYTVPYTSSFRPVLVVSSLSLLSSSASSLTAKPVQDFVSYAISPLRIENRVLFPDHVLLLLSGGEVKNLVVENNTAEELECVYVFSKTHYSGNSTAFQKVLSVDEYDELRSIVRCPLPPSTNFSSDVNLRWHGKNEILEEDRDELWMNNNWTVQVSSHSWENLAYAAALDGSTVVVFVKGLNLRPDRASDPTQFSCYFGSGKRGSSKRYVLRTKALTAAQEVVRCALPSSLRTNPDNAHGIPVTIGITHNRVIMPSVTIISEGIREKRNRERKYELCVCTMVWNQASALREWVTYHAWLGVERWFVYDNNSDDSTAEIVRELDRENYNVTRHSWPWIKTQEAGFSHCALRARDECDWVSFMDVDEYFYFPYSHPRRQRFRNLGFAGQNSLRNLVSNLSSSSSSSSSTRSVGEIRTTCHSFGPSGLSGPPRKGLMVGYTCRLQSPERHKSIVRLVALNPTLLNVVHHFRLRKRFKYLNLPQSIAVINHYKYQVWDVFRAKFYRRVATYVADWGQNQNEGSRDRVPGLGTEAIEPPDWSQRFCEVWDTGLRDFVLANLGDVSTGMLPWEEQYSLSD